MAAFYYKMINKIAIDKPKKAHKYIYNSLDHNSIKIATKSERKLPMHESVSFR